MKKLIIFISSIMVMMSLVGCGSGKKDGNSESNSNTVKNEAKVEEQPSFKGRVSKIDGDTMLVIPALGEDIRSSGDLVSVGVPKNLGEMKVGDAVKVTYDGDIMESYPLQVNVISIERIDEDLLNEGQKSSMDDTDSISNDADSSNFVDWKDVLKDSIGIDVTTMLDSFDIKDGKIKVHDSAGIMLPGLMVEGYEWKIDIEDENVLKFLKMGYEKGVVGERQGNDFFAFNGLKEGESKVTIKTVEKSTGKVLETNEFIIKVVK